MGSFMTNRYAGGNTHMTLKQDLITQAKQRCHELGGNAIVECKMAISRGTFFEYIDAKEKVFYINRRNIYLSMIIYHL